jgi:hypothetical protein
LFHTYNTPENRLLLCSVRIADPGIAVRKAETLIQRESINWPILIEAARIHSIRPQLENLLRQMPQGMVPECVSASLSEATRENLLRQMRSMQAFFELKGHLDNAGVKVILYKGPWLAEHYYGSLAQRESYDLDLFIDIRDLESVKLIMKELGYENRGIVNRLTDEYIRNNLCEFNFEKYDGETRTHHIEFHWSSSRQPFRMRTSLDELRDQITTVKINDRELQVFTAAAELLLVVMHHGGKEQYAFLKQPLDIAHILQKENEINWSWFLEKTIKYHLGKVLFIGVRQANLLTAMDIPGQISKKCTTCSITRMADERIRMTGYPATKRESFGYVMLEWWFHMRSREGLKLKLQLVWHAFRKVLLPGIIPSSLHHYFFNKKIREKDKSLEEDKK